MCNTCTIRLVRIAYARAPWFRLVREPLRWGMRGLAWFHRIDPAEYAVRTQSCYGCMRFYKVALKEKSALFRWLNDRVNPAFDALLEHVVTAEEVQEAKAYARQVTVPDVTARLETALDLPCLAEGDGMPEPERCAPS
ncbi:MAG: nitroreductase [Anaerolineae bacterium]|nr:nitroreductase [Anaerolineae bacterium]